MNSESRLTWAAILFAVLWTGGMIWWTGPEPANVLILAICGAIAAALWYFVMRKFMRWQFGRRG